MHVNLNASSICVNAILFVMGTMFYLKIALYNTGIFNDTKCYNMRTKNIFPLFGILRSLIVHVLGFIYP